MYPTLVATSQANVQAMDLVGGELPWLSIVLVVLAAILALMNGAFLFFARAYLESLKSSASKAAEAAAKAGEKADQYRLDVAEKYPTKADLNRVEDQVGCKVDHGEYSRNAVVTDQRFMEIQGHLKVMGGDIKTLISRQPSTEG